MRIFVLTQEEPFHLPRFFRDLLDRNREIIGLGIGRRHNAPFLKMALRHYELFGLKDFVLHGMLFGRNKILNAFPRGKSGRFYSVRKVAAAFEIPAVEVRDVNGDGFPELLKNRFKPDLIVSVSFSQILKKEVLSVPPLGCINIHSGLLPSYRGMLPTFWAMLNGERTCGVTIHYINEKIDQGKIIVQRKVEIEKGYTLYDLIAKTKEAGLNALLKGIDDIRNHAVRTIDNDPGQGSYYSFPKKEDGVRFKKMGYRFL